MRTEKEIRDEMDAIRQAAIKKYGYDMLFGYKPKYIHEYDEKGEWIGAHRDPEQEKIDDKLRELERELVDCGYWGDNHGEYGGGTGRGL